MKKYIVKDDNIVFISNVDHNKFIQFGDFVAPPVGGHSNIISYNCLEINEDYFYICPKVINSICDVNYIPLNIYLELDYESKKGYIHEIWNKENQSLFIKHIRYNHFRDILNKDFDPPIQSYEYKYEVSYSTLLDFINKYNYLIATIYYYEDISGNMTKKQVCMRFFNKLIDIINTYNIFVNSKPYIYLKYTFYLFKVYKMDYVLNNDITFNFIDFDKYYIYPKIIFKPYLHRKYDDYIASTLISYINKSNYYIYPKTINIPVRN